MEEKKAEVGAENQATISTATEQPSTLVGASEPTAFPEASVAVATPNRKSTLVIYAATALVVVLIALGLLFILEQQGRVSTGVFSGVIAQLEKNQPVALVNGVKISKADYDNNIKQIGMSLSQQGADITNPDVQAGMQTQAIDTLVNTELLRQLSIAEGFVVDPEDVQSRYDQIQASVGGPETLAQRMQEAGVTEEALRRDITNEQLIEQLISEKIDLSTIEITDEEVEAFYEQVGGEAAGLPPLDTIREDVIARLRFDKEQALVNEYIQQVRSEASIEILL